MEEQPDENTIFQIVEAVGQRVIKDEFQYNDEYPTDDDQYIPRLKRIARSVSEAGSAEGLSLDSSSTLKRQLIGYARDHYIKRWIQHTYEDETQEEARKKGIEVFNHVLNGGSVRDF